MRFVTVLAFVEIKGHPKVVRSVWNVPRGGCNRQIRLHFHWDEIIV